MASTVPPFKVVHFDPVAPVRGDDLNRFQRDLGAVLSNLTALVGTIGIQGDNPLSTTPFANTLTPKSLLKAAVTFTVTGGGGGTWTSSVKDGLNVSSVTRVSATVGLITFASNFASANYIPLSIPDWNATGATWYQVGTNAVGGRAVGSLQFFLASPAGAVSMDALAANITTQQQVAIFGAQ